MAKKGNRVQVILECTEHKTSGQTGMSRYITTKNRRNTPDRLELKKFNPVLKAIKMVKSEKSGAYVFVEAMMSPEFVKDWLKEQK